MVFNDRYSKNLLFDKHQPTFCPPYTMLRTVHQYQLNQGMEPTLKYGQSLVALEKKLVQLRFLPPFIFSSFSSLFPQQAPTKAKSPVITSEHDLRNFDHELILILQELELKTTLYLGHGHLVALNKCAVTVEGHSDSKVSLYHTFNGTITAGNLSLHPNASCHGDVNIKTLSLHPTAQIKGKITLQ